ncbi:16910_t:CDS:2, partial [Acaulospora colombiana]
HSLQPSPRRHGLPSMFGCHDLNSSNASGYWRVVKTSASMSLSQLSVTLREGEGISAMSKTLLVSMLVVKLELQTQKHATNSLGAPINPDKEGRLNRASNCFSVRGESISLTLCQDCHEREYGTDDRWERVVDCLHSPLRLYAAHRTFMKRGQ